MKQRYAIIRGVQQPTFDPQGPRSAPLEATSSLGTSIKIESLEPKERSRIRSDAGVIAIAPELPTRLIEPVNQVDGGFLPQANAANNTWGIEAVAAHTSPLGGQGITVAVLDTGIDINHPAFQGTNVVQKDFSGSGNGDVNGHGTHTAATVCGQNVNNTRIGVARNVQKLLIGKVLDDSGSGNTLWSFQGIQWAVSEGANVISMSLGIAFTSYVQRLIQMGVPADFATSLALEGYRATINAYTALAAYVKASTGFDQPCVVVAAAGNENRQFANPDWDITVSLPAATTGIFSVAAVGQSASGLKPALFSNSGANVTAPGVSVVSAAAGTGGLITLNGTSMATPHVAGVAALWAQWLRARSQLTAFNLETKLAASATTDPLANGFEPADVGLGLVQAPQSA